MGLFSFAKGILKAVPVVGDIVSAGDTKKALRKANDATQLGITNGKNDITQQLAATQGRLDPYETTGTDSMAQIRAILGLNGADAQSAAITGLQSSPLYQSLFRTGQDTVLNNLAATGGLRGGNGARSLYNLGTDTLSSVIQQQLANLAPLMSQGFGAVQFGGNLGAQAAGNLADLDVGSGQSNAGMILGKQNVDNSLFSGLRQKVQQAAMAAAGGGAAGGGGFDFGTFATNMLGGQGNIFGGGGGGGGGSSFINGLTSGYGPNGGGLPNFPKVSIGMAPTASGLPF